MIISIQYDKIPFSEVMTEYIINKLTQLGDKYQWIEQAQVFFKRESDLSGNGEVCKIELRMPGPNIFASSSEKNFELAAKETTLEIERQLQKRKVATLAY